MKPLLLSTAITLCLVTTIWADTNRDSRFNQDRDAILSMSGEHQVTFKFDETLTLDPNTKPSKRKVSRAFETVFVLDDEGDRINMQHLLVVERENGDKHIVKHWRQDWNYEPAEIMVFLGKGRWDTATLSKKERRGAWKQTVYQVDDSPRYAGYGKWVHVANHSYWESNETWRPLPRREHSKRDDYNVLVGQNRHSITPDGWAHEQDNYKLVLDGGLNKIIGREIGVNTYTKITDYDFSVAEHYWDATRKFWEAVVSRWEDLERRDGSLNITQIIDEKRLYHHVMPLAEAFVSGEATSVDDAMAQFETFLEQYDVK